MAYYGGGFQALVASTGPTELAYVPADAAVVAYADVKSIMNSELRQRFKQTVPMPMGEDGQREFLEKTGIDIENDIDYVVAAATRLPNGDGTAIRAASWSPAAGSTSSSSKAWPASTAPRSRNTRASGC